MATRASGSNRRARKTKRRTTSAVAPASVLYMAATLRAWVKLMRHHNITPQFIRHQVLIALHDYAGGKKKVIVTHTVPDQPWLVASGVREG